MTQQLRRDGQAVQRAGHHLESAQAALRRPLAEGRLDGEEAQKVARGHCPGHGLVEGRSLRGKAVWAVGAQLVREVAAGDEDGAAAELFHRPGGAAAEPVVLERGEAREAHAHYGAGDAGPAQVVKRYEGAVV